MFQNNVADGALSKAMSTIENNLTRLVTKGKMCSTEMAKSLPRVSKTDSIEKLGSCDLVIEAASEKEEVKKQIFGAPTSSLEPHTILATNTSSISVTQLAQVTDSPDKFMGVHFMNPVPVMNLVELIWCIATSDGTFSTFASTIDRLGKTAASSEDYPAFIVNRVLIPMINEAVYVLYKSVVGVASID